MECVLIVVKVTLAFVGVVGSRLDFKGDAFKGLVLKANLETVPGTSWVVSLTSELKNKCRIGIHAIE